MRPNPTPIQGPTMTPETPKPVEVTQADRDLRNALEQHAHGDQGGNGYLTDDALPCLARHRLSARPEAQSPPTVSGTLDGNDIWEALFGIMRGNVPEQMTDDVCEQLAAALSPTVSEADGLADRLSNEADLCRNDGADDIADLLDEARAALAKPERCALCHTAAPKAFSAQCNRPECSYRPQTIATPTTSAMCDWPVSASFTFYDDPGEHDPCYVVMPGGAMLPLNHHAGEGVDIARAKFIIDACNEALRAQPSNEAEGWREAPREPTPEMIARGLDEGFEDNLSGHKLVSDVWRAMWDAAPG